MAFDFSGVDSTVSGNQYNIIFFTLMSNLQAAGWVHVASGDGDSNFSTTAGNSNNVITGSSSGPNGMGNSNSWFVLKQPTGGTGNHAGTRELLFQGGNNNWTSLRIFYSLGGGFGGGTPSPTQTVDHPADAQVFDGGGTPGAPTFVTSILGSGTSNDKVSHVVVGDSNENFAWYITTYHTSTATQLNGIYMMEPILDGSFASSELDPFIFWAYGNEPLSISSLTNFSNGINTDRILCWFGKGGLGTDTWNSVRTVSHTSGTLLSQHVDHQTGRDAHINIIFGRDTGGSAPGGIKGVSSISYWATVPRNFRTAYDVDGNGINFRANFGDITLPWRDGVDPVAG